MSFDARSRERLEALGRSLPKPLPTPTPPQQGTPKATDKRHRVEVEENPEALFRELMQVSPDGTVPPHLMERLRELEARRQDPPPAAAPASGRNRPTGANTVGRADPRTAADHVDLYTAFQQLLLEDDEDA
ncbi:hypothetical protein KBY65_09060 [Cyanobium sp. Alchichica 3B3-8F6]|uniref:hypothetical protein n=1 Tax=Synechococcales TaxID=1890424 RepID=UPI000B98CA97|nr:MULTISPECIES: hypothetical protein [Synechococcales]MCP9882629.1 hypothetical protein [Cyanobium sp. Alchichica 3B3-8F6]